MLSQYAQQYARQIIVHYKPREIQIGALFLKNANPPGNFNFCYVSLWRQLFFLMESDIGQPFSLFHWEDKTAIFTEAPIDPETVANYQLAPIDNAMGAYIWQVSQELGLKAVELAKDLETAPKIALLTRQTTGGYRITYFDTRGPVNHICEDTPEKLLSEVYREGYREFNPGALDLMALDFDENLLIAMQKNS